MLRAALAALLLSAAPAFAGDIGIHGPYAIAATPMATMGSAYMLIHNHGDEPDRLLGASTPAAERVELHASTEEDGIVRMEPVEEGLEIAANGELLLERGGTHLMLVGLTQPFEDGAIIELTLDFERSGPMTFRVPVDLDRFAGDAPAPGLDADHAAPADGMDHEAHMEGHEGH